MAIRRLLAGTRPVAGPGASAGATTLLAVAALTLGACDTSPEELAEGRDIDTSETTSSDEVSTPAEAAGGDAPPDADETALATVVFDGTPRRTTGVACEQGAEVSAPFEDGGELRVATEDDGTITVRIVVVERGEQQAWAAEDPEVEALTFLPDGAAGTVTVSPVDPDGAPDAGRDDAELIFDLPCDA